MQLKKDERYSAFIKLTRVCKENRKIDFNLFFSIKVLDIKDDKILFGKINPLQYLSLIEKNLDFFVIVNDNKKKYIDSVFFIRIIFKFNL